MQIKNLLLIALHVAFINGLVIPDVETILNFDSLMVAPHRQTQEQLPLQDTSTQDSLAPIIEAADLSKSIPGKYIVVFKDGIDASEILSHLGWVRRQQQAMINEVNVESIGDMLLQFNVGSFTGYSGYFSEDLIKMIQLTHLVKFIEQDAVVQVHEFDIQKDATWALSRISHRQLTPSTDYLYDNDGGEGVVAYVIDTGIKTDHEEFEGRASWGESFAFPRLRFDGHGHGTHCAGIIGSKTYGVAKNVELVAVGVMNALGSGTISDIIKGVEFVVNEHQKNKNTKKGFKGSVVNMSIGGGDSNALDLAVNAGTSAGLHIAVAAGNENEDACTGSPSKASGPITVGASNSKDEKASFSNWGNCVDIFAPGEDILSTFTWSKTVSMSGTSMASPHIAGLLSYYLSLQPEKESEFSNGKLLDPLVLKSKLIGYGTKGKLSGLDAASPNILAYNGGGDDLSDFWA